MIPEASVTTLSSADWQTLKRRERWIFSEAVVELQVNHPLQEGTADGPFTPRSAAEIHLRLIRQRSSSSVSYLVLDQPSSATVLQLLSWIWPKCENNLIIFDSYQTVGKHAGGVSEGHAAESHSWSRWGLTDLRVVPCTNYFTTTDCTTVLTKVTQDPTIKHTKKYYFRAQFEEQYVTSIAFRNLSSFL